MENNRLNSDTSGERENDRDRNADPNAKERQRKGDVRKVTDPESYDDEYETEAEDQMNRDEAKSEKENRPGEG